MNRLNAELVTRLSAGPVITSISDVVKELIENSLDANASNVVIRLTDDGLTLIQVKDNGNGIPVEDHDFIGCRNYTSKITDLDSLNSLSTYGFRGEALHSMCALSSRVTVWTRTEDESIGTLTELDHDANGIKSKEQKQCEKGTTVSVHEVFSRIPVRRKHAKQQCKKQIKATLDVVKEYALANPSVRFVLQNSRRTELSKPISSDFKNCISSLFGTNIYRELKFDILEDRDIKIEGFFPHARSNLDLLAGKGQHVFVNRRPVEWNGFERMLRRFFMNHSNLETDRYSYFMFVVITVPPDSIDVNLCPNKRKVFLQQEKFILSKIESILQNMFPSQPTVPSEASNTSPSATLNLGSSKQHEHQYQNSQSSRPSNHGIFSPPNNQNNNNNQNNIISPSTPINTSLHSNTSSLTPHRLNLPHSNSCPSIFPTPPPLRLSSSSSNENENNENNLDPDSNQTKLTDIFSPKITDNNYNHNNNNSTLDSISSNSPQTPQTHHQTSNSTLNHLSPPGSRQGMRKRKRFEIFDNFDEENDFIEGSSSLSSSSSRLAKRRRSPDGSPSSPPRLLNAHGSDKNDTEMNQNQEFTSARRKLSSFFSNVSSSSSSTLINPNNNDVPPPPLLSSSSSSSSSTSPSLTKSQSPNNNNNNNTIKKPKIISPISVSKVGKDQDYEVLVNISNKQILQSARIKSKRRERKQQILTSMSAEVPQHYNSDWQLVVLRSKNQDGTLVESQEDLDHIQLVGALRSEHSEGVWIVLHVDSGRLMYFDAIRAYQYLIYHRLCATNQLSPTEAITPPLDLRSVMGLSMDHLKLLCDPNYRRIKKLCQRF